MTEKTETSPAAHHLITHYGEEARTNAILRSERARLDGDFTGYKMWKAVGTEIFALQRH